MVKVGEHIALDFLGIKQEYTPKFYGKVIYKIAKAAKVEILNVSQHKFKPQGFTLVALLAESHMSFHTFPEKNIISFDFFTCAKISPSVALDILKKEIKHERIVVRKFDRSTVSLYDDIYSTPGQKKYYVVNKVLEDFVSKVGQHIEILELEEFGKSLFIDNELQVAEKDEHIYKIGWKVKGSNTVKCVWGDAFESLKSIEDSKYDKIFVDLNDDQYCIDLASKNMNNLKRILKPGGVITAQVGSQDKKPKQVDNWLNVLHKNFGNSKLDGVFIPSFDCNWNFASSVLNS